MYIAAGQGQSTPGDKILMSTETSRHFGHLLQVKKKSLRSDFIHFFFMILYMFIAPGRGRQPLEDKVLMTRKMFCQFVHLL